MCKRALLAFNWRKLTRAHLNCIQQQALLYDELVLVMPDAAGLSTDNTYSCGQWMTHLHHWLQQHISIPFYLLPIPGKGVEPVLSWLRWRILCPAFQQVITDETTWHAQMETVLRTPVTVIEAGNDVLPVTAALPCRRGLFITRAQPFHNGHLAYIQQMQQEVDELIVVIAMANRSHQQHDIATGGERLAMVKPVLQQVAPGRYYLVALPYSDFAMENLYELEYLLPAFDTVYTVNPSVIVMAQTAGYATKGLDARITVSSTLIRNCMIQHQPYAGYVPQSVHDYIEQQGIAARLRQLQEKENRG
ncbi:nicotinamide-nucleotide adenylyltransferase [Filimonas lacunae]|uniref:Nicotinamide-nucleotide adenylyltransferase n=1 Tax=Filimonas lacunae TaxID=477680 RepID=A0A173MMP2_9BACT|nr:adenylyltransferase/cytidyltransferase family protein [Filimonas lacunae]BAV08671.1 nicotinamide-nucleotide adenylyltransferase, NadM family [Filimonas lacunae]SIS59707.1 nicotinamide-nucleotide adenylyltransferase [Filimonas lacunae]